MNHFKTICAAMTLLIGIACVPSSAAEIAASNGSLSVTVNPATGAYAVTSPEPAWTFGGSFGQSLSNTETTQGVDKIGEYHAVIFHTRSGDLPLTASIRAYDGKPLAMFLLTYNRATSVPAAPFPHFNQMPAALHCFSYRNDVFAPPSFTAETGGTPWLLFDDQRNAAIISPAGHFQVEQISGDAQTEIVSRFNPALTGIPAQFTQQTLLATGLGINRTWDLWGQALTDWQGKTRPANDSDTGLKYLGYWTDNGAYYYYNYDLDKGYAGTLLALADRFRQEQIPIHYLQLDSWWYSKTLTGPDGKPGKTKNPKLPVGEWNRYGGLLEYKAHPALFPQGLAAFQKQLGLPLVTHNRWIDPASTYHQKYKIEGYAAVDPRFWQEIADYAKSSGIVTYEQDWLNWIYTQSPALSQSVGAGDAFLDGMANAFKKNGQTLQYCMPLPNELMQGSRYSNLTTTRTSDDRFKRNRWHNFLFTSRLASAIGVWPWTDTFDSGETDNLLLADLSAGMVGFGDKMGTEDKANLLRAVRADGVIVKPDTSIVPIDAAYLSGANRTGAPLIASAYTDHSGVKTAYVFAFGETAAPDQNATFSLADLGLTGPAYIYDYFTGTGERLDSGSSFTGKLDSSGAGYYVVSQEGPSGITFLGDHNMFVSNGKQRIAALHETPGRLAAEILFAPNEQSVSLHGCAPTPPKISVQGGAISSTGYDPASGHFTVIIAPSSQTRPDKVSVRHITAVFTLGH